MCRSLIVLPLLIGIVGGCQRSTPNFQIYIFPVHASHPVRIEVAALPTGAFDEIDVNSRSSEDWQSILKVSLSGQSIGVDGKYRVEGGKLIYQSSYGLAAGAKYQVQFEPSGLGHSADAIVKTFAVPKSDPMPRAVVTEIFPTGDILPCNQLKFYVTFSRPMRGGDVFDHVRVEPGPGKSLSLRPPESPVPEPFREVELWNESNTGLTLYIHPGRIKRGVALKDEMGPVFEPGRRYALVIDRGMRDAAGNPLAAPHRKVFQTVAADRAQPNIRAWEVKSPRARSLQPLEVRFGESLDYALLQRMLWVEKSTGPCGNEQTRRVSGKIQVDSNERRWRLTPEGPWEPGTYRLVTDSLLEDLAGNSLKKPFEVDIRTPKREVADTVSVAFNIDGK